MKQLKITRHLEHVEVEEGGTAIFSCELNHEAPSVQWLFNDKVVHASYVCRIQNSGKVYSLVLKMLTPQDSRVTFKTVGISESTILRVKGQYSVFICILTRNPTRNSFGVSPLLRKASSVS